MAINPRSGFCKSNSIFYSKRNPIPLPPNPSLAVTTFVSSAAHSGTVAFIDSHSGDQITFSDLWSAVDSISDSLHDIGIQKGDVVVILSPNSINFPIVCLSVMSLGAIITTANPLNTANEISKQIADSRPKLAFTTRELAPKLADSHIPIVLLDGVKNEKTGMRIVATLESMRRKESSGVRVRDRVYQDDPATLLYSSGTTGASKGVVSSHKSLIAMTQSSVSRFGGRQILLCTVPMFHIYGLAAFVVSQVATGSTVVILSKFSMDDMLSSIEKYKVTYLPLVPPILVALINDADTIKRKYDLSSMRSVLSGGAPLSKEVIEGFVEKYPTVEILQGYGLTESTGIGSSTDCLEESRRYGTAGLLSPNIEAKIVDTETGMTLSVNETGELWMRGQSIMKGYFGNDEATKATIDDEGWLKTGDLCYIDDDGFLFVVDRLKELIKYKGYQVPPAELEALLLTHPQIADVAVIPFPDKEVGQFPMAYVVRKSGSNLSETEVINFVAQQVAPYKKVRRVAFVSSVPKNPSGKILRKDLIKLATSRL